MIESIQIDDIVRLTAAEDQDQLWQAFAMLISSIQGEIEIYHSIEDKTAVNFVQGGRQVFSNYDGSHGPSFSFKIENSLFINLYFNDIEIKKEQLAPYISLLQNLYKANVRIEQDFLTGLFNRRRFDRELTFLPQAEYGSAKESYLAILDIDYFKNINDTYGHIIGDEVLVSLAQLLQDQVREKAMVFRLGGEEFSVLFSACSGNEARALLEGIRQAIAGFEFPREIRFTVSIGYAAFSRNLSSLYDASDKALFFAKANGRNACYSYDELIKKNSISPPKTGQDSEIEYF